MRELIERLERGARQGLRESEVYVDENGWAHDDEGNKWKVGSGAPSGVYKGTTFRSGRSYKAWRNQGQGVAPPADRSADKQVAKPSKKPDEMIDRVSKVLSRAPSNSFLLSILDQLKRGRQLSQKQVDAFQKFERPSARLPGSTATAKPPVVSPPKAPPSTAAAASHGGARSPDAAGSNERLDAIDALLDRRSGDRFLQSLRDQVHRGRELSDKQKTALRQNFHRAGMSARAKVFEGLERLGVNPRRRATRRA